MKLLKGKRLEPVIVVMSSAKKVISLMIYERKPWLLVWVICLVYWRDTGQHQFPLLHNNGGKVALSGVL